MSQNLEPFEYDSEEIEKPKTKDPNRKMKNLFGDFWQNQSISGESSLRNIDDDNLLLPNVNTKLKSTKFVKADVLLTESASVATVKLAPKQKPKPNNTDQTNQNPSVSLKRDRKQEFKEQELETKLTQKYGKALKMLQKSSGFQLGQGVGKNNQGILNPIEAVVVGKGGVGTHQDLKQKKKKDEAAEDNLNMDINNIEAERQQAMSLKEKMQEDKQKLDKDDKDFLQLLQGSRLKKREQIQYQPIPQIQTIQKVDPLMFEDLTGRQQQAPTNPLISKLQSLKTKYKHHIKSHMNKQVYLENQYLHIQMQRKSLDQKVQVLQEQKLKKQQYLAEIQKVISDIQTSESCQAKFISDAKQLYDQDQSLFRELDVSFIFAKNLLESQHLEPGLQQVELYLDVKKLLEIQIGISQEQDQVMFTIFNDRWLPLFQQNRDPQCILVWSHLMPDLFKQKYTEQCVVPWLMTQKLKSEKWVKQVCSWGFLIQNMQDFFALWLTNQNTIDKESLSCWLSVATNQTAQSQMLKDVKKHYVNVIGKSFKVNPSNQDISLVNDLLSVKDLLNITDIVAELITPRLLACLQIWLKDSNRNLKEIWMWYNGWKKFIMSHGGVQAEEVFYLMCLLIKMQLN